MLTAEFVWAAAAFILPPLFGFAVFALSRAGLSGRHLLTLLRATRMRHKSVKFFECATYSRLLNSVQYDVFVLSFCVLFILYDVDLIFFFTEATCLDLWAWGEVGFLAGNFILLALGLWYDYVRLGFNWSH